MLLWSVLRLRLDSAIQAVLFCPLPTPFETDFWSFHWGTTNAAVRLAGREVLILHQLLCFRRVSRLHRVRRPFLEHLDNQRTPILLIINSLDGTRRGT